MNLNEVDYNYDDYPYYHYEYYEQTFFELTYDSMYEQQAYRSDYIPAFVKEPHNEISNENQDFQIAPKSEKQK